MGGKLIAREKDEVRHSNKCGSLKTPPQNNVFVEGKLVAIVGTECTHRDKPVSAGASRVYCHGQMVARESDPVDCNGKIATHCERTWAGD